MNKILIWPNPIFSEPSETIFDEAEILKLSHNMTLALANVNNPNIIPVGLSAVQIGVLKKVIIAKDGDRFRCFVNALIIESSEDEVPNIEGCLSIPETFLLTKRRAKIKVMYQEFENGRLGAVKEDWFDGQLAKILQHEIEHTEGRMFTGVLNEKEKRTLFVKMTQYKKRNK